MYENERENVKEEEEKYVSVSNWRSVIGQIVITNTYMLCISIQNNLYL